MKVQSYKFLYGTILIILISSFECVDSAYVTSKMDRHFKKVVGWPDSHVSSLNFYGSALAICPKSHKVVVLHRCDSWKKPLDQSLISCDTVFVLDSRTGGILFTWGKDFFVKPHGIEISQEGDLFVTDVAMHQVFKFPHVKNNYSLLPNWSSLPELILGERFVSGNDKSHFCAPSDVAVVKGTGEFFVADGYCNSRVVKFSKDGEFLQEFGAGTRATAMKPTIHFNVTHALAIGYQKESSSSTKHTNPVLFVADRNNGRIQCFTLHGTFLYEIGSEEFTSREGQVAMLFSISFVSSNLNSLMTSRGITSGFGLLYAVTGKLPRGQAKVFEIAVGLDNYKVLSEFPISNSSSAVQNAGNLETPHDLVVSGDGNEMYIVEASGNLTLWKFMKSHGSGIALGDFGMSLCLVSVLFNCKVTLC